VTTAVSVQAYESLPVCDQEGCIFGTPVASSTTSTAAATTPFDFLLPAGSDAIVGEWRTRGSPAMTTVFDTPTGSTPINNVNAIRQGTLTYNWQPIPDGYNITTQTSYQDNVPQPGGPWAAPLLLDAWMANNAVPFSALDGQFSADFSEVQFSNGQCQVGADYVMEWVCELFAQFNINAFTNMREGVLFLQPKVWSYIATINVDQGPVVQRVFAGCPEVSFTQFTNGFVQLTLVNSLPTPIDVIVRTTTSDNCPTVADVPYSMLPKQTISTFLFPCGQQLITVLQTVGGGQQSVCASGLNITFNPLSQANVALFVSPTTNRSIVDDAIQAQLAQGQLQFVQLIQNLVPLVITQFTPTLTVPERADAINNLISAYNTSITVGLNAATTIVTQTALEAIQPLIDQFNQQAAKDAATNALISSLNQQFSASVATSESQLVAQQQQTNLTSQQLTKQILVDEGSLQTLQQNQAQGQACNWCGKYITGTLGDALCSIICSIITFLIGALPIILIVLLVYCCCFRTSLGSSALSGVGKLLTPSASAPPPPPPPTQPVAVVKMQSVVPPPPPQPTTTAVGGHVDFVIRQQLTIDKTYNVRRTESKANDTQEIESLLG
jgi:hypothetical protein